MPGPLLFEPITIRDVTLKNRVVVSPMAQYSAIDGVVGDYHLVHLGARAMGGAALVMAEMTCVSGETTTRFFSVTERIENGVNIGGVAESRFANQRS